MNELLIGIAIGAGLVLISMGPAYWIAVRAVRDLPDRLMASSLAEFTSLKRNAPAARAPKSPPPEKEDPDEIIIGPTV